MLKKFASFAPIGIIGLAICCSASAQEKGEIATHCRAGEFAYLNANMSKARLQGGGYKLVKTGNVLSICADRKTEPFLSLAYRYGPAGKPEMEKIATVESKFSVLNRSTSPHTGENLIFFTAGPYTYCISEATGQGSGIGLAVFKSKRKVLDLFSGNHRGTDFESEMLDMNFDRAQSPIFKIEKSAKRFQTACDAKK